MELTKKMRNFAKELHDDESAPGTVEWVLLVIVALIVMIAIYFIAQWVLSSGAAESQNVIEERDEAHKAANSLKGLSTAPSGGN